MKKAISLLLACTLMLGCTSAMAAKKEKESNNNYTIPMEGTVLQNAADRNITPKTDLSLNPVIEGESPTTGLPTDTTGLYLPMLVQISNPEGSEKVNGKNVKAAGIGARAPWGGQYADVVYEGILYRSGQTRITFLFNDGFADGLPTSVGPVRSARIGHVLLREEWQGGLVFAGGPRREENNISAMFAELGASEKGVVFNLLDNDFVDYKNRVKGIKAPDNYDVNVIGIRSLIPASTVATPHPFLFADTNPYTDGYDFAYSLNLDWGHDKYISHFYYDESNNLYLRYSGDAPYMTFASAEDRAEENMEQISFSNVIIQRIGYDYTNNSKIMPVMQSVGKGNADIFIGGRYIPGYWVRKAIDTPTIFFDDQGNELQFTRGKTFIAH
ncbi:MAG: DUF3048 C-terminal domain-containing protein, partial [Clostridia bacterium]